MYYATNQIPRFRVSGYISRAWKKIGPICFVEFAHLTYSGAQRKNRGRKKTSDTAGGLQISDVSLLAMDRLETCICIGQS